MPSGRIIVPIYIYSSKQQGRDGSCQDLLLVELVGYTC